MHMTVYPFMHLAGSTKYIHIYVHACMHTHKLLVSLTALKPDCLGKQSQKFQTRGDYAEGMLHFSHWLEWVSNTIL